MNEMKDKQKENKENMSQRQEQLTEIELKKEYLKGYEKAIRQLERSELKMKEIRLNKMCPSIINDGMPHASNKTDLSSYIVLLEQEEKRYMKYRYQRVKKCKEITDRIERLESEDEKDVLMYRYIKLMKWEDICMKVGYSWKQVHRIHGRALENFII